MQPSQAIEEVASGLLADGRHYADAVTTLGDQQAVLATEDIYGANGIKLIGRGSRIDSRVREKLAGHRLPANLDESLAITGAVNPQSLAVEADRLIRSEPFWQRLATRSGDAMAMRHGIAAIRLPGSLACKLTVARELRPSLYAHSLRVAILCNYLALRLGFSDKQTQSLLLAALCHDLGELHTDPAILDPSHRISEDERRYVYVHPATGYLILRDIAGVPGEVARAVLHHHERLDGSGYPAGLFADQIEPLAWPLMVADTVESVMQRFTDYGRLSALLRLNLRKYDKRSVDLMHEAVVTAGNDRPAAAAPTVKPPQLLALARLFDQWAAFRQELNGSPLTTGQSGLDFLQVRLQNLNSLLYQFGFDPSSFETLIALSQSDPEVAAELSQVIDELRYQLAETSREIDRRASDIDSCLSDVQRVAFADWRATLAETLAPA